LQRRLLSPGFSISYLNGLEPTMQSCVAAMVSYLDSQLEVTPPSSKGWARIDMYSVMNSLTSDIISATAFGSSFNSLRTGRHEVKDLIVAHLRESMMISILTFLRYIPFYTPKAKLALDKIADEVIAKRRLETEKAGTARKDLLQIFLDAHAEDPNGFSEKHVKEAMRLFIVAGSDTTGTTAFCALLLLLENPDKLKLLREELDATFGIPGEEDSEKREITFAATQECAFLNGVINESLRLMPVTAGGLPRYTTQKTVIDGFEVPADVRLLSHLHLSSRSRISFAQKN
jgi:cytochrome P450